MYNCIQEYMVLSDASSIYICGCIFVFSVSFITDNQFPILKIKSQHVSMITLCEALYSTYASKTWIVIDADNS